MDEFESQLLKRASEQLGEAIYALQEGQGGNSTAMSNSTARAFIDGLLFAESKSIRTSTVILATFNIIAALATALSILYDAHWAATRSAPSYKKSKYKLQLVGLISADNKSRRTITDMLHPAETFSLILAIGIVIQGCVFAASQGTGLKSLFTTGCATTAQFMLPGNFHVENNKQLS